MTETHLKSLKLNKKVGGEGPCDKNMHGCLHNEVVRLVLSVSGLCFPLQNIAFVSSLPSVASSKLTSCHFANPTHTEFLFPEGSNKSSRADCHWLRVGHVPLPTVTVIGQTWVVSPPLESEWSTPLDMLPQRGGKMILYNWGSSQKLLTPLEGKTADLYL